MAINCILPSTLTFLGILVQNLFCSPTSHNSELPFKFLLQEPLSAIKKFSIVQQHEPHCREWSGHWHCGKGHSPPLGRVTAAFCTRMTVSDLWVRNMALWFVMSFSCVKSSTSLQRHAIPSNWPMSSAPDHLYPQQSVNKFYSCLTIHRTLVYEKNYLGQLYSILVICEVSKKKRGLRSSIFLPYGLQLLTETVNCSCIKILKILWSHQIRQGPQLSTIGQFVSNLAEPETNSKFLLYKGDQETSRFYTVFGDKKATGPVKSLHASVIVQQHTYSFEHAAWTPTTP